MLNLDNNTKSEIFFLRLSVHNYIDSVNELHRYYEENIINIKIESMIEIVRSSSFEITEFDSEDTRKLIEKNFNNKESINNSLYFFSISIIENTLRKIAILLDNSTDSSTLIGKGKNIQRTYRWINGKVNINKSFKHWSKLLKYYEIRNYLIHNGGIVPKFKLCRYVNIYKLKYDKFWGVIIDESFQKTVCEDIINFFDEYFDEIEKHL